MLRKELEQQQMVNDILKQPAHSRNTKLRRPIVKDKNLKIVS
ncbi:hypothetical protein AB1K18_12135 [Peribacillus simplex]